MNFAAAAKKESSCVQNCNKCIRSRVKIDEIEQLQRTLSAKDKKMKMLNSKIQQLKDENEDIKRKKIDMASFIECLICLEKCTQSTVVFNCGHYCCSTCAKSLKFFFEVTCAETKLTRKINFTFKQGFV